MTDRTIEQYVQATDRMLQQYVQAQPDPDRQIFRFFDLPREMRDWIYDHVAAEPVTVSKKNAGAAEDISNQNIRLTVERPRLTSMCLVSKQFRAEYLRRVDRQTSLLLIDHKHFQFANYDPTGSKFQCCASTVRSVEARIFATCSQLCADLPDECDLQRLESFLAASLPHFPSVKSLVLRIGIWNGGLDDDRPADAAEWPASEHGKDLEAVLQHAKLLKLPHLDRLDVYHCEREWSSFETAFVPSRLDATWTPSTEWKPVQRPKKVKKRRGVVEVEGDMIITGSHALEDEEEDLTDQEDEEEEEGEEEDDGESEEEHNENIVPDSVSGDMPQPQASVMNSIPAHAPSGSSIMSESSSGAASHPLQPLPLLSGVSSNIVGAQQMQVYEADAFSAQQPPNSGLTDSVYEMSSEAAKPSSAFTPLLMAPHNASAAYAEDLVGSGWPTNQESMSNYFSDVWPLGSHGIAQSDQVDQHTPVATTFSGQHTLPGFSSFNSSQFPMEATLSSTVQNLLQESQAVIAAGEALIAAAGTVATNQALMVAHLPSSAVSPYTSLPASSVITSSALGCAPSSSKMCSTPSTWSPSGASSSSSITFSSPATIAWDSMPAAGLCTPSTESLSSWSGSPPPTPTMMAEVQRTNGQGLLGKPLNPPSEAMVSSGLQADALLDSQQWAWSSPDYP